MDVPSTITDAKKLVRTRGNDLIMLNGDVSSWLPKSVHTDALQDDFVYILTNYGHRMGMGMSYRNKWTLSKCPRWSEIAAPGTAAWRAVLRTCPSLYEALPLNKNVHATDLDLQVHGALHALLYTTNATECLPKELLDVGSAAFRGAVELGMLHEILMIHALWIRNIVMGFEEGFTDEAPIRNYFAACVLARPLHIFKPKAAWLEALVDPDTVADLLSSMPIPPRGIAVGPRGRVRALRIFFRRITCRSAPEIAASPEVAQAIADPLYQGVVFPRLPAIAFHRSNPWPFHLALAELALHACPTVAYACIHPVIHQELTDRFAGVDRWIVEYWPSEYPFFRVNCASLANNVSWTRGFLRRHPEQFAHVDLKMAPDVISDALLGCTTQGMRDGILRHAQAMGVPLNADTLGDAGALEYRVSELYLENVMQEKRDAASEYVPRSKRDNVPVYAPSSRSSSTSSSSDGRSKSTQSSRGGGSESTPRSAATCIKTPRVPKCSAHVLR